MGLKFYIYILFVDQASHVFFAFYDTFQWTLKLFFLSNHRCQAKNAKFNMKFDTIFHGLLSKIDKLDDDCLAIEKN
jgi:hypothetical protein